MPEIKEYNNINQDIGSIESLTKYDWFNNKTYLDRHSARSSFIF